MFAPVTRYNDFVLKYDYILISGAIFDRNVKFAMLTSAEATKTAKHERRT